VRNWASLQIGVLNPLRNIFFALGINFLRASPQAAQDMNGR
jgi:hypothetical protein